MGVTQQRYHQLCSAGPDTPIPILPLIAGRVGVEVHKELATVTLKAPLRREESATEALCNLFPLRPPCWHLAEAQVAPRNEFPEQIHTHLMIGLGSHHERLRSHADYPEIFGGGQGSIAAGTLTGLRL